MAAQTPVAIQATNGFSITPHDTNTFQTSTSGAYSFATIYVGGEGDISVLMVDGGTLVFTGVPAGTFLPVVVSRVNATGTTATNILGLVGRFGI